MRVTDCCNLQSDARIAKRKGAITGRTSSAQPRPDNSFEPDVTIHNTHALLTHLYSLTCMKTTAPKKKPQ